MSIWSFLVLALMLSLGLVILHKALQWYLIDYQAKRAAEFLFKEATKDRPNPLEAFAGGRWGETVTDEQGNKWAIHERWNPEEQRFYEDTRVCIHREDV